MNLNLSTIEAAVLGRTQFVRKDFQLAGRDLVLFDYVYAFPALFDEAPGLCECRGVTFDRHTGEVVSRPYHKFFNAGEIPGTSLDVLDLTAPHVILEKLDGSMIRVVTVDRDGTVFFGTRMGVTDIALQAADFVRENPQYTDFCRTMYRAGYTAIFEWCSRQNRVVIDHPVDRLVLTGVRSMADGTYMKFSEMRALAEKVDIECVQAFDLNTGDRTAFKSYVRGLLDTEGFVIRFENGYMVKVKADDYVARHKTLGLLRSEKVLFETLLTGMLDDALPRFSPADQDRVRDFYGRFVRAMDARVKECQEILAREYADRKDFALKVAAQHGASGALFQAFGNPNADLTHLLWGVMRKLGTVNDPDRIRRILGAPELVWDVGRRILTGDE